MNEDLDRYVEEQIRQKEMAQNVEIEQPIIEITTPSNDLSDEQKYKIEQEAQAKAVVDKATEDPKALVKAEISQRAINLVRTNDEFGQQIDRASKDTAQSAINEVQGDNRKSNNESYYTGREKSISSLGGDAETSQDRQKYMHWIYTGWWYVLMTLIGIPFVAPLKVLFNWGLALSPETIKTITDANGKTQTVKTKKLHWLAGLFSFIFYIAYLTGLVLLVLKISSVI